MDSTKLKKPGICAVVTASLQEQDGNTCKKCQRIGQLEYRGIISQFEFKIRESMVQTYLSINAEQTSAAISVSMVRTSFIYLET